MTLIDRDSCHFHVVEKKTVSNKESTFRRVEPKVNIVRRIKPSDVFSDQGITDVGNSMKRKNGRKGHRLGEVAFLMSISS